MSKNDDSQRIIKNDIFKTGFDDQTNNKSNNSHTGKVIDGLRIEDHENQKDIKKAPFYKTMFANKIGLFSIGILFILVLFFGISNTPKQIAENYIKAITSADYGKAYQFLDVKQHKTLSTASYLKFIEFARSSKEDNIYKLSQNELKSMDLIEGLEKNSILPVDATVVVKKYNSEEIHKLTIYIEKKKSGPLGIFSSYKIAGTGIYGIPKINCLTGTEQVSIDNVNLAEGREKLNLNKPIFYGWHDIECKGKFYDTFRERTIFTLESGILKLDEKKFKLNNVCKEVLTDASKDFVTSFFPATITNNGYEQCKTVSNEKTIDEMFKSFSDGFKQVGVLSINITDGKLLSYSAGENGNLHCQYQYFGVYERDGFPQKQCTGIIAIEYIDDKGQLIVARINDYNINLKD